MHGSVLLSVLTALCLKRPWLLAVLLPPCHRRPAAPGKGLDWGTLEISIRELGSGGAHATLNPSTWEAEAGESL